VFVKNGAKGEVVAGNKVIEAVRWISYQTGLADVRNKAYDVNGALRNLGGHRTIPWLILTTITCQNLGLICETETKTETFSLVTEMRPRHWQICPTRN
jgi:hypothetical protein